MSTLFPVISANADVTLKYRASYSNFNGVALTNQAIPGKRFAYDGNRRLILSAITNGTTFNAGLYPIVTTSAGAFPGDVTNADAFGETGVVGSRKLTVTWDGAPATVPNITSMFAGTLSLYSFGIKFAVDDGTGKWVRWGGDSNLFLPDSTWFSTVNYSTGAVVVYTTSNQNWATGDLTLSYTSDTVDADTLFSITGTAPVNLSAFFKNAPYSYFKEDHDLIIGGEAGKAVSIAYAEVRG